MGYGLLLFGYIFAFFFSSGTTYFFADVIGACICAVALYKLSAYDRGYFKSVVAVVVYAVVCLANGAALTLGYSDMLPWLTTALSVVKLTSIVVFHALMLAATARMCVRAELPKYAKKARSNFILTLFYCVLDVAVALFGSYLGDYGKYVAVGTVLLGIVWLLSNAYLIFRCFQLICEDGDEKAENGKSKYAFVNKISSKIDKLGDLIEHKSDDKPKKKRKK